MAGNNIPIDTNIELVEKTEKENFTIMEKVENAESK